MRSITNTLRRSGRTMPCRGNAPTKIERCYFGGRAAPASLKRRGVSGWERTPSYFGGDTERYFRGRAAPASLKRGKRGGGNAAPGTGGFRGPRGPGLIEARKIPAAMSSSGADFGGRAAPASLKPRIMRVNTRRRPAFRGPRGPGLIEAPETPLYGVVILVFRGPRGPGLIEAICVCVSSILLRGISGAARPRPH